MPFHSFSVLISPTFRCNADCEYCFENKTTGVMDLVDFGRIVTRLAAYFVQKEVTELDLYWQGGEIFTLDPEWLLRAQDICRDVSVKSGIGITNKLQSNLIGYGPRWRRVMAEMFDDTVGSSLDYPNLYRKVAGRSPETYNETWFRQYQMAREAGIEVAVIAVLNRESLRLGAHEFYAYYAEKFGIKSFQTNTPYPGGLPTPAKRDFPLDNALLGTFYSDLLDIWMRKARHEGVSVSPFDQLVDYFRTGEEPLSCVWTENCANSFLGIDPKGNVGQCECWVASYPDFVFGNILTCRDMGEIMNSPVRRQFLERPLRLVEEHDCVECEYLAACHGGCPIRAFSTTGCIFTKDPYCQASKTLFVSAKKAAVELDRMEIVGRAGVQSGENAAG